MSGDRADSAALRRSIREWLRLRSPEARVEITTLGSSVEVAFERRRVSYPGRDGQAVPAFSLVPDNLRAPSPRGAH